MRVRRTEEGVLEDMAASAMTVFGKVIGVITKRKERTRAAGGGDNAGAFAWTVTSICFSKREGFGKRPAYCTIQ